MKPTGRPACALTALQVMVVMLAVFTLTLGCAVMLRWFSLAQAPGHGLLFAAAALVPPAVCGFLAAQWCFFSMCGRLKTQSAFTQSTSRSLRHIRTACGINAILLMIMLAIKLVDESKPLSVGADDAFSSALLGAMRTGNSDIIALILFISAAISLIAHILHRLTERASLLQAEYDATV